MAKEKAKKNQPIEAAKLKFADLKALSKEDIVKKINELRSEASELKRNTVVGDVQNVRAYIKKRRDIARALTAQKQLAEEDK